MKHRFYLATLSVMLIGTSEDTFSQVKAPHPAVLLQLRIGRRQRLVTLFAFGFYGAFGLRIGRRQRLVTLVTACEKLRIELRIGRRQRLVTLRAR